MKKTDNMILTILWAPLNPIKVKMIDFIKTAVLFLFLFFTFTIQAQSLVNTDNIALSPSFQPTANAGNDTTICRGNNYQLHGSATYQSSIYWNTSGDGYFSNPSSFTPTYFPGFNDMNSGSVTLTLSAFPIPPETFVASDFMILTIEQPPTAYAGPDAKICSNGTWDLEGQASNYQHLLWTSNGNGHFDNDTILTPNYTPGTTDIQNGSAVLTLKAFPFTGSVCNQAITDNMILTVLSYPSVDAGSDATICSNSTYTLQATATYASHFIWQTSGTGTFNSDTLLHATYTPSTVDIANDSVILTVTALPVDPCPNPTQDFMTLRFQHEPTLANAGPDTTICQNATYTVTGQANNYNNVAWNTSGDGTFNNPSMLTTTYTPGINDKINRTVTLTLTVFGKPPCNGFIHDAMVLTLAPLPVVSAGNDAQTCETVPAYTVSGTAQYASAVLWQTRGDGSFSNPASLTTTYTSGTNDITNGSVVLLLKGYSTAPCTQSVSDSMTLSFVRQPMANAGNDARICQSSSHTLSGSVSNSSSAYWITTGDGTFNNPDILNATYTPGQNDILNDSVILTLNATGLPPCNEIAADEMVLRIAHLPTANAGQDATICANDSLALHGIATYYHSVHWTTTGNGTFLNPSSLNTYYKPGSHDITGGSASLTLTVYGDSLCGNTFDQLFLIVIKTPQVSAGNDATICQNAAHSLAGTASNQSSLKWRTSGDGTFSDQVILNPTYTPGTTDIINGTATLTLTAYPNAPCADSVSDFITLTIAPLPVVNAGDDATICSDGTHMLTGQATHYSTIHWITSGDGVFDHDTILAPKYTPGPNDIQNALAVLTLTATSISPCSSPVSDNINLSIIHVPVVDAGANDSICANSSYTLSGISTHDSHLLWTTSGDGTFSNDTILNAVYTPGNIDSISGYVKLALTGNPLAPCSSPVSDTMNLKILLPPIVEAGPNDTICKTSTYTLSGQAAHQGLVKWTSSGDGSFNNVNLLTATYTPGTNDLVNGYVQLSLTAWGKLPCTDWVEDYLLLFFSPTAVVNAGRDTTICESEGSITLSGTAQNTSSVQWFTKGNGTFNDSTLMNATYTFGSQDITKGYATLTLKGFPMEPCTATISDSVTVHITKQAIANAGPDAEICGGSTYQLTGSITNSNFCSWATSGDGTFSNTDIATPIYTPGTNDLLGDSVVLTIYAWALSPCNLPGTDAMTLLISHVPTANAGPDAEICGGDSILLTGSSMNYKTILWTTSGNGTFTRPDSLITYYKPGSLDITNGTATITLKATSSALCESKTDQMILTVHPAAIVNAGIDQTINIHTSTTLHATYTGSSSYSFLWTPSDLVSDPATLEPTTVALDTTTTFTFTVTDLVSGCASSDKVTINVELQDVVLNPTAEPDTLCKGLSTQLFANASNGTGSYNYYWTSRPQGFYSILANPEVSPDTNTTYIVIVNDGHSSPTDSVKVYVKPRPSSYSIVGQQNVSEFEYHNYTVSQSVNSIYFWWVDNGSIFSGQGTNDISVHWGAHGNGNVYVTTLSPNGCYSDTSVLNITIGQSGINENELPLHFVVFPNPSNNFFNIEYDLTAPVPVRIELFNLLGERIAEIVNENQSTGKYNYTIQPSSVAGTGNIFYLKVQSGDQIFVKKIVQTH